MDEDEEKWRERTVSLCVAVLDGVANKTRENTVGDSLSDVCLSIDLPV